MNDRPEGGQGTPRPGLCETCRHAEVVVSQRGSRFVLCGLSRADPGFPRYPPLPVLACDGYDRRASAD
jgi:hypothetical protein